MESSQSSPFQSEKQKQEQKSTKNRNESKNNKAAEKEEENLVVSPASNSSGPILKDFESYDKISESSEAWFSTGKKDEKWVVLEKVHGSNFSFVVDDFLENEKENENEDQLVCEKFEDWKIRLRYAKRTAFLKKKESFFG